MQKGLPFDTCQRHVRTFDIEWSDWINRIVGGEVVEGLGEEAVGDGFGGREIIECVVAAVASCGSRDFAFEVCDEFKHVSEELCDVCRLQIALHEEVGARAASHRSPIDNLVAPVGVVAQICSGKMLDSV